MKSLIKSKILKSKILSLITLNRQRIISPNFFVITIASILCLGLVLAGCASAPYKKPPQNDPSDDATIKLAEAANSISDSMIEMAKVEKIILPSRQDNTGTIPNVQNLQTRASVDWSGPMTEITEQIALAANYRLRVIGRPPAIPVLISLNVKDQSLAEILRNIDYQAGKKANIRVYPNTQVVELRYAQFYS